MVEQEQTSEAPEKPESVSQEWDAQLEYAEDKPDTSMSDPFEAMPTSYPSDTDYYFFGDGRAIGKFSIPTEPTEDVTDVLATLAPDTAATFIKVTVDNREGESQYTVDTITGYDADGQEYNFEEFGAVMSEPLWEMWENVDIFDDAAVDQHDDLSARTDSFDNSIEPGAVKDIWLISQTTDLQDEFARLGVNGGSSYMGGFDPLPLRWQSSISTLRPPTN